MEKKAGAAPPAASFSLASSARWEILRRAFLSRNRSSPPPPSGPIDHSSQVGIKSISRKTGGCFKLISCQRLNGNSTEESDALFKIKDLGGMRDAYVCYELPLANTPRLILIQRIENYIDLDDFEYSNRYDVDNTGLICCWPSEDVLAHFCLNHLDMFRSKRVLELGSGYGLAGLAIAAGTDACEVVISDGNPLVVDYIQRNINTNAVVFGDTKVKSMTLHWSEKPDSNILHTFDIIVASDCTFFKEFHESLALTVKSLLRRTETSEALFFCPKRGDSLDKFLAKVEEMGLHIEVIEKYDDQVWKCHLKLLNGDDTSWPNYNKDHCYPMLVCIYIGDILAVAFHRQIFEVHFLVNFSYSTGTFDIAAAKDSMPSH